jgi:hypothetical protein
MTSISLHTWRVQLCDQYRGVRQECKKISHVVIAVYINSLQVQSQLRSEAMKLHVSAH